MTALYQNFLLPDTGQGQRAMVWMDVHPADSFATFTPL